MYLSPGVLRKDPMVQVFEAAAYGVVHGSSSTARTRYDCRSTH